MNFYGPRQRKHDQRWDYACESRRLGVWPIGYCAALPIYTEEIAKRIWPDGLQNPILKDRMALQKKFEAKYHTFGHATPEEACACYKEYLLDQELSLHGGQYQGWHACQICKTPTQYFSIVGEGNSYTFPLCDIHRTREEIEKILRVASSWET